jgi:micrococcal nuclease
MQKLMSKICFSLLVILSLCVSAWAKEPIRSLSGIVVKVSDGDSITVDADGTKLKVRLYGIDAPETEKINRKTGRVSKQGQPYGAEAHKALTGKILHKRIDLDVMDIDKYRRCRGLGLGLQKVLRQSICF